MKNKKMILGIAIIVMALVSACGSKANPQSDFEVRNIDGDKSVEITGYIGTTQNVTIPSKIRGLPVTSIGETAFRGKNLTSVTIPDSVIEIGEMAFIDNQLTSVTIPDSVTVIKQEAFAFNQLTSITIPSGITEIWFGVFRDNQLTSVTISDSVTAIEGVAFSGNQLTSVTIPNSVTSIGHQAFEYNNQLTSITIGASVLLESSPFSGVGFESAYNDGGKLAGTYTRPDPSSTAWARQ